MSQPIFTDLTALAAEYNNGASAHELAVKYNTSTNVVTQALRRGGVQIRNLSDSAKLKLSKYTHPSVGRKHSEEAKQKMRDNHADFKGANHPQFKGAGEYAKDGAYLTRDANGYLRRCVPGHPLASPDGLIGEHVYQACMKYGYENVRGNDVHHINGVKDDNRWENLVCLTRSKHRTLENNLMWGNKK